VCLVRARELRYEDVREAAGGGVEGPRNGREVTEPGASRDYLAGRPSKIVAPGPVLTGMALVTGRFLSPESAALLDTLIEGKFR
jgi:hypothetical protein